MSAFFERLQEERKRLKMNQTEFGDAAQVGKNTQVNYESGKRKPDSDYLAAIATLGVDVKYIITGVRDSSTLLPIEQAMLTAFRSASSELQGAALNVLLSGKASTPAFQQTFNGGVGSVNKIETGGGTVDLRVDMRGKK